MNKKVAVILINWNSFPLTAGCIESLCAMKYTDYDIIVVDNDSTDNSRQLLTEKFARIILLKSDKNLGFTGGNNLGMQYAIQHGYTYQLLLNNDTFVADNFLELLVNYMDKQPEAGAIQPLIYCNHNRELVWNAGSYYNHWLGYCYTVNYHKILEPKNNLTREVDWITGCAFFIRTSVLLKTGLLAENMFMYYEDIDCSFRIRKAGFKLIFYPQSVIYHIAGMSNKNQVKGKEGFINPVVHYLNIRNRIWMLKKYTLPQYLISVWLYNGGYIIAVMGYFLFRLRFTKLKTVIKAVKHGLTGSIAV